MTPPHFPHLAAIAPPALALLRQFGISSLAGKFCLGGGTALAGYFGHRISVDLDWFTSDPFDPMVLRGELPREDPIIVVGTAANTLLVTMNGVKVDFLRYDYPRLEPETSWEGVRVFSIADIAAMKLSAVANRGSKKDFFDIVCLLQSRSLNQLLVCYERKFAGFSTLPVIRSLGWFEDAEEDPEPMVLTGPDWPEVKKILRRAVSGLL